MGDQVVMPCVTPNVDRQIIQRVFSQLYQRFGYTCSGAGARKLVAIKPSKKKKGVCRWTIYMIRENNRVMTPEHGKRLIQLAADVHPPFATLVGAGRCETYIFFEYSIVECQCELDFPYDLTPFPIEGQQSLKHIFLVWHNMSSIVHDIFDGDVQPLLQQLFHPFQNATIATVTLIHDMEYEHFSALEVAIKRMDELFEIEYKSALQNDTCNMVQKLVYPVARRDESIEENHHGTTVPDPYRWLEDPDSDATQEFVDQHNKVTQPYLEDCDQWNQINRKLTTLWNYPKYNVPDRQGKYYFSYMNTGLQNQNVLYKQASLDAEPEVFLDPNSWSTDGTIALSGKSFSDDGSLLAYALSESGSDWIKIKIRNVETGEDFPEVLDKVKFSPMAWTLDNKGLFYCRYPEQDGRTDGCETLMNENQKLYYHRVGEPQQKDVLVAEFLENPSWRMSAQVSDCGKYLFLIIIKDSRDNLVYFADLEENGPITGKLKITPIVTKFESDYDYITNTGPKAVFRTNKNAPNYRLIVVDVDKPEEENWTTLIEEHERDVLDWAQCVNKDKLVVGYLHDVKSVLQVRSLADGKPIRELPLEIGSIVSFSGHKKQSEIFYQFVNFVTPGTIYQYDFAKPNVEPSVYREVKLKLEGFNRNDYEVEQVFYSSRDGTKVPMFTVAKKLPDGAVRAPKPCLLYGYGGFNINIQPMFSVSLLMFIESFDGVLAFPNIRGGGEYGEKWHNGGRLLNKQNVFDDFQAAAQYLVEKNYTVHNKIVIQGGSNGGLLVGACINQRPDLFGAAISQGGVMDMLRFHKFTIGHAWCSDYGNPDEKEHFENVYKFSPLHNVRSPTSIKNQYPATLILTADHDDRVSPLHSLKFAAALHNALKDNEHQVNPVLLRVYSKAGHGAGKPTTKKIEEATDILTFIYKSLKLTISIE